MPRTLRPVLVLPVALLVAGVVVAGPAAAATPGVTSFTPTSGGLGTSVTITGSNFVAGATVAFGAGPYVAATYSSATKISAIVTAGSTTGTVKVRTSGGTAASSASFTVTPSLALSPTRSAPGTTVTLKGAGFARFEAVDVYVGTTDVALVTTDAYGGLSAPFTVPATAVPGPLWVSAVGRHSGSAAQRSLLVQTDWPQFGGGPAHPFVNMRENAVTSSTVGTLDSGWSFPSGEGSLYSPPVLVAGVVYWASIASVWALNEATGTVRWQHALGSGSAVSTSGVAVVDGSVYVGTTDDKLVALRTSDGHQVWSTTLGGQVYGSPAVTGGVVYVGSYDGSMYALSATTGAIVWHVTLDGPVYAAAAVAGGRVFIGTDNGTFYALSASTGESQWAQSIGAGTQINAPATVYAGVVYVAADDKLLHAWAAETGGTRWTSTLNAASGSTAVVAGGDVYLGDALGNFYAVSASSGALVWSTTQGGSNASPTYANGLVFSGSADGRVTAFYAGYGGVAWTGGSSGVGYGAVVLDDGHLLVPDSYGSLLDFEPTVRPDVARPDVPALHPDPRLRPTPSEG